mmetsp:Transcript_24811/g.69668  ORF Transcript_24811/g.69668 Transcript_24811/m.69668 type:complete len:636 (-) Transcript_24811:510-2417(-)
MRCTLPRSHQAETIRVVVDEQGQRTEEECGWKDGAVPQCQEQDFRHVRVSFCQFKNFSLEFQVHGVLGGGTGCQHVAVDVTHRIQQLDAVGGHNFCKEERVDLGDHPALSAQGVGERGDDGNHERSVDPSECCNLEVQRCLLQTLCGMGLQRCESLGKEREDDICDRNGGGSSDGRRIVRHSDKERDGNNCDYGAEGCQKLLFETLQEPGVEILPPDGVRFVWFCNAEDCVSTEQILGILKRGMVVACCLQRSHAQLAQHLSLIGLRLEAKEHAGDRVIQLSQPLDFCVESDQASVHFRNASNKQGKDLRHAFAISLLFGGDAGQVEHVQGRLWSQNVPKRLQQLPPFQQGADEDIVVHGDGANRHMGVELIREVLIPFCRIGGIAGRILNHHAVILSGLLVLVELHLLPTQIFGKEQRADQHQDHRRVIHDAQLLGDGAVVPKRERQDLTVGGRCVAAPILLPPVSVVAIACGAWHPRLVEADGGTLHQWRQVILLAGIGNPVRTCKVENVGQVDQACDERDDCDCTKRGKVQADSQSKVSQLGVRGPKRTVQLGWDVSFSRFCPIHLLVALGADLPNGSFAESFFRSSLWFDQVAAEGDVLEVRPCLFQRWHIRLLLHIVAGGLGGCLLHPVA